LKIYGEIMVTSKRYKVTRGRGIRMSWGKIN